MKLLEIFMLYQGNIPSIFIKKFFEFLEYFQDSLQIIIKYLMHWQVCSSHYIFFKDYTTIFKQMLTNCSMIWVLKVEVSNNWQYGCTIKLAHRTAEVSPSVELTNLNVSKSQNFTVLIKQEEYFEWDYFDNNWG